MTNPRWSNGHDFRLSSHTRTSAGDLGSTPSRGDFFTSRFLMYLKYMFLFVASNSLSSASLLGLRYLSCRRNYLIYSLWSGREAYIYSGDTVKPFVVKTTKTERIGMQIIYKLTIALVWKATQRTSYHIQQRRKFSTRIPLNSSMAALYPGEASTLLRLWEISED